MWLESPAIAFVRYWFNQGLLHMNAVERLHRLFIEVTLIAIVTLAIADHVGMLEGVLVAFMLIHTLSALFNGHPVALWRHVYGAKPAEGMKQSFMNYLESLTKRLNEKRPAGVEKVCIMGSVVRGELRPTSDVDMAIIARPGVWNAFLASNYLLLERMRAFIGRFPLDAYMYRSWQELENKMRILEESPLVLYQREGDDAASASARIQDLRQRITLTRAVRKSPRMILVGAGGGHLTEALLAVDGVRIKRTIATFCLPHTRASLKGEVIYCLIDPHGDLLKYIKNLLQSLWMVLRVRPHAVLSSGGGMTIAACLVGKLVGAKLIYVESGARVHTMSKTGKFLYRYADLFIVQWRPLAEKYPKAIYGGVLL